MYKAWIKTRNFIESVLYRFIAKPIFFALDPEWVHERISNLGHNLGGYSITRFLTSFAFNYKSVKLTQKIAGIEFANPVGLSAGYDKEGLLTELIPSTGFGFMELGSVTAFPHSGNEGKRLARLPKEKSLIVNYGLNSSGSKNIAKRLNTLPRYFPIGISIAPTNRKESDNIETAINDYLSSFKDLAPLAQYIDLNLSCPNTNNELVFLRANNLEKLLNRINAEKINVPIFIKLSPDINNDELYSILEVADKNNVKGIICTNLTKVRPAEHSTEIEGGLSGKLVQEKSDKMIAEIYKKYKNRFVIIGVGGIFTAKDAYRKIKNGATFVQLFTGMIYQGPQVISTINLGLVKLLEADGFKNIGEAIGKNVS